MSKKQSLNIGLSSMRCWLYMDGDMTKPPIRAFADANCDVFTGEFRQTKDKDGNYDGGEGFDRLGNYVEYSPKHIVKIRDGWDGFTDEKYYAPIPFSTV